MNKNNFTYSSKNYYNLRNISKYYNLEVFEFAIYCVAVFILPFIIAHPQWIIGILVNFFLIRSAIYFKLKYILPIILLPSLGVLAAGLIFGTNTHFLLYFIPMIWISNLTYVLSFKFLKFRKNMNLWITPVVSSLIKAGLLFGYTCILVYFFNFPIIFLTAMGILQLITAFVGGYLAIISSKFI
jgi:hypothetical protein